MVSGFGEMPTAPQSTPGTTGSGVTSWKVTVSPCLSPVTCFSAPSAVRLTVPVGSVDPLTK